MKQTILAEFDFTKAEIHKEYLRQQARIRYKKRVEKYGTSYAGIEYARLKLAEDYSNIELEFVGN